MHINTDAIKNTVNEASLNNTNASAPKICLNVAVVPFAFGGVSGKAKLNKPNIAEAMPAILKVNTKFSVLTLKTLSIIQPVAIHPIVPKTLIDANYFPGSFIFLNATEFAKANYGEYNNKYTRKTQK